MLRFFKSSYLYGRDTQPKLLPHRKNLREYRIDIKRAKKMKEIARSISRASMMQVGRE